MKIKPGEWLQMNKMDRYLSLYNAFLTNRQKVRENRKTAVLGTQLL
ncbi:hypothetical protein [Metabacillus fastidiosus]|nr:hypothetical protein [Metabacillus fastidiosus]